MKQIGREEIVIVLGLIVSLIVLPTYLGLFNGTTTLQEALTPYWIEPARKYPVIVGFGLVGLALIIGGDNVGDLLDM